MRDKPDVTKEPITLTAIKFEGLEADAIDPVDPEAEAIADAKAKLKAGVPPEVVTAQSPVLIGVVPRQGEHGIEYDVLGAADLSVLLGRDLLSQATQLANRVRRQ